MVNGKPVGSVISIDVGIDWCALEYRTGVEYTGIEDNTLKIILDAVRKLKNFSALRKNRPHIVFNSLASASSSSLLQKLYWLPTDHMIKYKIATSDLYFLLVKYAR